MAISTRGNRQYYVYIMTNRSETLYVGVTGNLEQRIEQHRTGKGSKFTSRYRVDRLIYFEVTSDVHAALEREKQIKSWSRKRKLDLVATTNPEWRDLSKDWYE